MAKLRDSGNPWIRSFKKHESVCMLAKKLADWCKNHTDPTTGKNYDQYRDGLKIYTTIDPKMQLFAEEAVVKHMANMQIKFNKQLPKNIWKGHEDILHRAMSSE